MSLAGWAGICQCGRPYVILEIGREERGAAQIVEIGGGLQALDVFLVDQLPFRCSECNALLDGPDFPIATVLLDSGDYIRINQLPSPSPESKKVWADFIPNLMACISGSLTIPRLIG
jgi:hypothetical protein